MTRIEPINRFGQYETPDYPIAGRYPAEVDEVIPDVVTRYPLEEEE